MSRQNASRKGLWLAGLLLALGLALPVLIFNHWGAATPTDPLLTQAFSNLERVTAYAEKVETDVVVSERRLKIEGIYLLDPKALRYQSWSTTTITRLGTQPKDKNMWFSLDNVSIADTVYFRIATKSKELQYILQGSDGWHRLNTAEIPTRLENIAVSGPIMDDLALFKEHGMYVQLDERVGKETLDEIEFVHFILRPSKKADASPSGNTRSILERIGIDGKIHVWIEPHSAEISRIRFEGTNYTSTTTLLNFDPEQPITAPTISGDTLQQ